MAMCCLSSHSDWLLARYPEILRPSLCATDRPVAGKATIGNSTRQESRQCDPELAPRGNRQSPLSVCAASLRCLFSSGIRDGVVIRLILAVRKREATRKEAETNGKKSQRAKMPTRHPDNIAGICGG